MNGVQDVIIYTGNHTDQIESYISEHPRWSPTGKINPFASITFIRVNDATSVGDFLRDLDKKGLVSGDFILVHGDCVANIKLDDALAKHKARRDANRDAVMTVVLRDGGLDHHRTKARAITPVFSVEAKTSRCLHYEEIHTLQSDHYAILDPTIFEHEDVELRTDLIDPGIDICTPDVLALWSESFDYELPRKNFLHGVLKDFELNGKLIFTEIVESGYAARASNLQMYDSITRDVLSRWTYPLVPDSNLVSGHSYVLQKRGVCREKGVLFESDTDVSKSVLGSRTTVGSGTKIHNSVIGRRCFIGPNVTIVDSYIWDDVTVEEDSVITNSVIGASATVGKRCQIGSGSIISFDVMISNDISLPSSTVLSQLTHEAQPVDIDTKLLGPRGKGARYKYKEEFEETDPSNPAVLQKSLLYSVTEYNISTSSVSTLSSEIDDDSDDSDDASNRAAETGGRSRLSSFASDDSGSCTNKVAFHKEAVNGLLDALRSDADDFESAKLEFMGLRLGQDASDSSVRRAVAAAFVTRAVELLSELEPAKAAEKAIVSKKGASKFLREVGVGGGRRAEQVDFILAVQKSIVSQNGKVGQELSRLGTVLTAMLQRMYSADIIEDEGILAWWTDKRAAEGESLSLVKARCKALIDWLEEDDDDSDEEEDEDSD